jgi:ATP-binding cassette subfamily B protein
MSEAYYDDDNYSDGLDENAYKKGMNLALWKKLFGYALNYKVEVSILIFCAMTTAVSEVAFPLITRSVIDAVELHGSDINLVQYALAYFAFVMLLSISIGTFIWFGGIIRTHVSHDIRQDGFKNLQNLSFSYYDYRPVGWLMARMTSDCERLSNILAWGMLDLVWGITMMAGIAIAMLYMNLFLGLVVLTVLPVLAWISIRFQKKILKSARQVRKTNSRITGSFNESIMGVQTTKAFVKETENDKQFGSLTNNMYQSSVLNAVQAALYLPIVLTLGALATGLALVIGGVQVMDGIVTAGTLVAFLTYTRHFFEPIEELAHWFAEMQMAQASAERIISLIEAEPEIQDSDQVVKAIAQTSQRALSNPAELAIDGFADRINKIELKNVSFAYIKGSNVLNNINLTIHQGESIAVVGSTGGGKSTLVNLLCRFYEPTEGQILIDGVDYRDRSLHWLQSNLGIVLQSSHIFGGTIADNIRYGKPQASITEVVNAASMAGADSFIREMQEGYDHHVGEGGNRLSAGQKQLISFARAILSKPQILVMDEATSSVDTVTEQYIQKGMQKLLDGRISLIIAHRLSTIRNADRILVIENSCIVEQGNHLELMAKQGRYHYLYTQQKIDDTVKTADTWAAS